MNNWYGNLIEDAAVTMTFNTFDADGESVTITDLVASDVRVSRDGSISQVTPGAGVTVLIDVGATGNHQIKIDTSDTTDVGFYAVGHDYQARIEGATVATKTVNAFIGSFSIENRYMVGTDNAATEVKQDIMQTDIDTIGVDVAGINGDAMRGTDSAATEAKQDAGDVVTNRIAAIQEGDEDFDYANGTVEVFPKGTTSGGLLKKNLYDKDDVLVADTEAIIARTENVTP